MCDVNTRKRPAVNLNNNLVSRLGWRAILKAPGSLDRCGDLLIDWGTAPFNGLRDFL